MCLQLRLKHHGNRSQWDCQIFRWKIWSLPCAKLHEKCSQPQTATTSRFQTAPNNTFQSELAIPYLVVINEASHLDCRSHTMCGFLLFFFFLMAILIFVQMSGVCVCICYWDLVKKSTDALGLKQLKWLKETFDFAKKQNKKKSSKTFWKQLPISSQYCAFSPSKPKTNVDRFGLWRGPG